MKRFNIQIPEPVATYAVWNAPNGQYFVETSWNMYIKKTTVWNNNRLLGTDIAIWPTCLNLNLTFYYNQLW